MKDTKTWKVMTTLSRAHAYFNMESIRKLSNFNFQWKKTLYHELVRHWIRVRQVSLLNFLTSGVNAGYYF